MKNKSSVGHLVVRALLPPLVVILAIIGIWQFAISVIGVPTYLMPSPLSVATSSIDERGTLATSALRTIGAAAIGLAVSSFLAAAIGLVFFMRRSLATASLPMLIAFRSAPIVAIAPIITLMTGRGITTCVIVVTIVTFFPMLINFMRGLMACDASAIELMHVYNGSRWQQLRYVRIPYSLPYVFTGLRISATGALLGAMLSEWITGSNGLGYLILESGEMRNTEILWAAVILAVAVSLTVFTLASAAERHVLHWRQQ